MLDGIVIDEVAGFEVVGGVEYDVRSAQELMDIGRNDVGDVSADLGFAIEGGDFAAGGFGFSEGVAGVGLIEKDLTLQAAFFDEVAVNEGEGSDAGSGEEAVAAVTRGFDAVLTLGADGGKQDLARVPFADGLGRGGHLSVV